MRHHLATAVLTCLPLAAQAPIERLFVVSEHPSNPRTRCYQVDPATGAVQQVPVHATAGAWQNERPTALCIDPPTRDLLLCTWSAATATTTVTRLRLGAAGIVADAPLATLPAIAVDASVQADGELFVAVEHATAGGVWRVPRDGGAPTQLWAAAAVSAMSDDTIVPLKYWAAQDQAPAAPNLSVFLASAPATAVLTTNLPLPAGVRVTALHEHLNSFWWTRELVVADDQGRLWQGWSTLFAPLTPIPLATPIAPGGARRIVDAPGNGYWVLGGAADPTLKFLYELSASVNPPVQVVATLPGDPVDVTWTGSAAAAVRPFGAACGPAGTIAAAGLPQLGNPAFAIELAGGLPNTFAVLAGASATLLLPVPVPPLGCALPFAPDVLLLLATDAAGQAALPVPVPASSALAGTILITQWWQLTPPGALVGSAALALHLWP
ncbi:MAG TPA: hypothetical protein VFZ65_05805 [Planctomycetota bacterium]|nr:hypothetical protein [Planctomycetota bacterium]